MGRFVIKTTVNNEFMFNLLADNNEVIATSQTYKSVENAKTADLLSPGLCMDPESTKATKN